MDDGQVRVLKARIDALDRATQRAQAVANAGIQTSAKRFRIGIFSVPLTLLGAQVTGSVTWSSPITNAAGNETDRYSVDASCSAFQGMAVNPVFSNQTSTGVTVSFVAPITLAVGTMVVVLAVAPAPPVAS
jgi:hypothetical protein